MQMIGAGLAAIGIVASASIADRVGPRKISVVIGHRTRSVHLNYSDME
jgi:hypothetical protein